MLSVLLDFEEHNAEVFFAMDDAEVELREDGAVSVVFEDYNTGRVIEVSVGPFLLEEVRRIKEAREVGCYYIAGPGTNADPSKP